MPSACIGTSIAQSACIMTITIDRNPTQATEELAAMAHWIDLIRAEYNEMPGMHLTKPQVQRLFGLDQPTCDALLRELERTHFLRCTEANAFVKMECE
jgi:hypothetical protein